MVRSAQAAELPKKVAQKVWKLVAPQKSPLIGAHIGSLQRSGVEWLRFVKKLLQPGQISTTPKRLDCQSSVNVLGHDVILHSMLQRSTVKLSHSHDGGRRAA